MNEALEKIIQDKRKQIAEKEEQCKILKDQLKELEDSANRNVFSAGSVILDGKRDSIEVYAKGQVQITSGCSMRRLYIHDGGYAYIESGAKVSTVSADTKATVVVCGGKVTKLTARDCTVDVCSCGVVNTMVVSNWFDASSRTMDYSIRGSGTLVKNLQIESGAKVIVNEWASACIDSWNPAKANLYVYDNAVVNFGSNMPRCLHKWWVSRTRDMAYELDKLYCPEWAKCAPPEWLVQAADVIEHAAVTAGQELWIASGGIVRSTTVVGHGAVMQVASGGSAITSLVHGEMIVLAGGRAINTVVCGSGHITVHSGGRVTDVVVSAGARLTVSSGASADAIQVHPRGTVEIKDGGTVSSLDTEEGSHVYRS